MPSTFPTALDSFTNPTPTSNQGVLSHAGQHADVNDAVEAVQLKLGIDGSADTSSVDYRLGQLEANAQPTFFRRDTLTAGAGDDTIGLNKTPKAYSVSIAVDKVPLEDDEFSVVSSAVTLATPCAGGEKVIVQYATDEPSPGPSVFVAALAITGTYPDGEFGVPYSEDLALSGGNGVYTLTGGTGVASGTLPAGLSLSIAGSGPYTLRLSGTPTSSSSYSFTVSVDSGAQTETSPQALDILFTPGALFAGTERGAWYDPSDISTLWKDTAGTTPVTTAGDPVARMDDKSGNGHHLTQTSSGKRPTYQVASGKPYLQFNGAQVLELPASGSALVPGVDDVMLVVGHRYDTSGDGVLFARAQFGALSGRYATYRVSGTLAALFDCGGAGNAEFNSSDSSTTARTYTMTIDRSVFAINQRIDGATFGSASGTTTPDSTNRAPSLRTLVGAYNDASDVSEIAYLTGRVYGVVLQLDVLNTTLRDKTETWMAAKL